MKFENLEKLKNELDRPALNILKDWKDIIGVEVGVQYGINTRNILEKYDIKTLYLVDPYTLYPSISGAVAGENNDEVESIAHEYLKDFNDKIIWIKEFSWNAVDLIPDNLDFAYIDGDHRYEPVLRDLKLYYPKVKSGGLFAFHDYASRAPGVVKAVQEFFKDKKIYSGGKWDGWLIKSDDDLILR